LTIDRCTAPLVAALTVVLAVPIAASAALQGGAKYAGKSDDGLPVTLRLSSDAGRIKKMRIHYEVTCSNGGSGPTYTDILNPRVKKDGSFKGSGTYRGSSDGSDNVFKVTGTVTKRKASGRFSLKATSKTADGDTLRCKSGSVSWSAKRQK
jgi:hypothetical protein